VGGSDFVNFSQLRGGYCYDTTPRQRGVVEYTAAHLTSIRMSACSQHSNIQIKPKQRYYKTKNAMEDGSKNLAIILHTTARFKMLTYTAA